MSWLIFFNHPLSFNNNNDNENDNDNNNDLLTDPLGGSSLLNYIKLQLQNKTNKLFTNYAVCIFGFLVLGFSLPTLTDYFYVS